MVGTNLSKKHRKELNLSGLSDRTIVLSGIYTETDITKLSEMLRMKVTCSAMVFPFNYDRFIRCKLDIPRIKKGRILKYESPWKSEQHPYFPPNVFETINENDDEIFFVEGEKKALKLWQELIVLNITPNVVGLTGVWGWKIAKEKSQQDILVQWLEKLHYQNRIVYLCFDNDVHWNKQVHLARTRFGRQLKLLGARVKSIDIPITNPSEKLGVDDYICKYGMAAFAECIGNSEIIDLSLINDIKVVSCDEVEMMPVEWLWHTYIPKGEITLLEGNPGLGKSQIVCDIAARVSQGWLLPPNELGVKVKDSGNVLMLCAEDTLNKTIIPRLTAVNANMSHIKVISSGVKPLTFPDDIDTVEQLCFEFDTDLLVIDPIMAFINQKIDTYSDHSTRLCLARLKEFAERTNISIIALRHLNKKTGDIAIYRGGGSIAFTATSRSVLIVGKHPEEENVFVLACNKNNLAKLPQSLTYEISEKTLTDSNGRTIYTSKIHWLKTSELQADDIVDAKSNNNKVTKLDKCVECIEQVLIVNGPMLSRELQTKVIAECKISFAHYQTARKKLKLLRAKNPQHKSKIDPWYTKLPGQSFTWEGKRVKIN